MLSKILHWNDQKSKPLDTRSASEIVSQDIREIVDSRKK